MQRRNWLGAFNPPPELLVCPILLGIQLCMLDSAIDVIGGRIDGVEPEWR
jgi:hypothetical protein